jgi:hypothetical protein
MRVEVEGKEYIDHAEIAKIWGLASVTSVTGVISQVRRRKPHLPLFPEPDLIIDQKHFWDADRIPEINAWRRQSFS